MDNEDLNRTGQEFPGDEEELDIENGEYVVYTLGLPDGTEKDYVLVATFDVGDKSYLALTPHDSDRTEVTVVPCTMTEDGPVPREFESQEEMDDAYDAFETMFMGDPPEDVIEYDNEDARDYIFGMMADTADNGQAMVEMFEGDEQSPEQPEKEERAAGAAPVLEDDYEGGTPEDYCYEDADGRLFIYGEKGEIIYLDENGDPIYE